MTLDGRNPVRKVFDQLQGTLGLVFGSSTLSDKKLQGEGEF